MPTRPAPRRAARPAGRTTSSARLRAVSGSWTRLRRGAYLDGQLPDVCRGPAPAPGRRPLSRIYAVLPSSATSPQRCCSACRCGTPVSIACTSPDVRRRPARRLGRCSVPRRPAPGRRTDRRRWRGRHRPGPDGARPGAQPAVRTAVVALDAALYERFVTREQLERRLLDIAGTRGSRQAARVIAFADRRSESVGESRSRVVLAELGLSPSTLQFEVTTQPGSSTGSHRLRVGRAAARRRVRWTDQVRPVAAARAERRRRRFRGEAPRGPDPGRGLEDGPLDVGRDSDTRRLSARGSGVASGDA